MNATFSRRLQRVLEMIQLLGQVENLCGLGFGELELERQFVVLGFAVFDVAAPRRASPGR